MTCGVDIVVLAYRPGLAANCAELRQDHGFMCGLELWRG